MSNNIQKSRGFEGELIIEIPKVAIAQSEKLPLINALFIARMGFYPKAKHHYYQRPSGISEVILLYCTAGKGWIQLQKEKITIQAGEIFIIPTATPHSYWADAENPWTIYWFHLAGNQCNETITAIMGDSKKGVSVGFSETRNAIFNQITTTFLKGYSTTNLIFANLLLPYYLATFVLHEYFQPITTIPKSISPANKAILFMQQNLSKSITLEMIAQSANLSIPFFSRKFRQETGYSPIEYFNHLRIQKACHLLHFSHLRINEVAFEIGINDPFYFSRLFKQQMGMSPVAYRKNGG